MDLYELKPGDRARTIDGNIAEVQAATEDGAWIKVKYVESNEDKGLVNTEDLCSEDELVELLTLH